MAKLLDGKKVAEALTADVKQRTEALGQKGIYPALAIVRVGENAGDIAYERGALKRAEKVGVAVRQYLFDENVAQEELVRCIVGLNHDEYIHGVLVFRPLPAHISDVAIREALDFHKDVDGITNDSMAAVYSGSGNGFAPCTAQACMEVLRFYDVDLTGKNVVVIGRSLVIGKPVANLLTKANATVTQCHTKTVKSAEICRRADIIVAAAGRAAMITDEFCSPGQIILDVGVNVGSDGKMCGDVCFESVEPVVSGLTPVPGGIGAVTSTILMKHVVEAAEKTEAQKKKGFLRLYK